MGRAAQEDIGSLAGRAMKAIKAAKVGQRVGKGGENGRLRRFGQTAFRQQGTLERGRRFPVSLFPYPAVCYTFGLSCGQ